MVRRGETLYSIAFRYDQDYRRLAAMNHLQPPYTVYVGQVLQLSVQKIAKPVNRRAPPARNQTRWSHALFRVHGRWIWPTRGPVAATFAPENARKGIDITGRRGQPILAAANGVVAYAGHGLAGYGNLIIIKHDAQRLTAYGYNLRNVVHEGQQVLAGQKIAEMGQINRHAWGLHFEVREAGRPVNPLRYVHAYKLRRH